MAKVFGFNGIYQGLLESEAWQRVYEYGKNFMPIRDKNIQSKYNRVFSKKTKVIRDNKIKKVNTDILVPGDIIILEKGEVVPVDGKILEQDDIEFDYEFIIEDKELKISEENERIVYQGMHIKKGRVIVEALKTGDVTYLGSLIKQIDVKDSFKSSFNKKTQKTFNIIGILGIILLLFGTIFSYVTTSGDIISRLSIASYSGLLLFVATLPIGAILILFFRLIIQKNNIKRSNLNVKDLTKLINTYKISAICIDDRFLVRNYEKYIQRIYSVGTRIIVFSDKEEGIIKDMVKESGICDDFPITITGNEMDTMSDEDFRRNICEAIIFCNINKKQKDRIIYELNNLDIKTLVIVDDISDLKSIKISDVAICTHKQKKSLEYDFSDATISGTDFSSIYDLIKGSYIVKHYMNSYIKFSIMFQMPLILSLMVALLAGIDLGIFYFQSLMIIFVIIPLLLLLIKVDYNDDKLFEFKEKSGTYFIECMKYAFTGCVLTILSIGIFNLLDKFGFADLTKVNFILVFLIIMYTILIFVKRCKISKMVIKGNNSKMTMRDRRREKSNKEEFSKIEKEISKKSRNEKKIEIKESKKKKNEDMGNSML